MKVELGGGTKPTPGYDVQIDPVHGTDPWKVTAQTVPWMSDRYSADGRVPLSSNSVESIVASHVLEHIPAGADRIAVFNEAHRVLVPGGQFHLYVPLVAAGGLPAAELWPAFADPTHVSFWVFPESLHYFTGERGADADYGIKPWKLETWSVQGGWNGYAMLTKPEQS